MELHKSLEAYQKLAKELSENPEWNRMLDEAKNRQPAEFKLPDLSGKFISNT